MKKIQIRLPKINSNSSADFETSISLYVAPSNLSVPDSPSNESDTKEFVYLAKYSEIFAKDLKDALSISYSGTTKPTSSNNIFNDFNDI